MTQHEQEMKPNITVIGVGGAGGNAVNNMIASQLEGVDFVVANTDAQALEHSSCKSRIQLGHKLTAGLGAGSKAEIGAEAAEESEAEIKAAIQDANMVFITAGMGGGTGTGAAPVIARISRELGILTIGVVTKPFQFEGVHRMRSAEKGLEEMARHVDTLIIIPNQNLFRICDEKTTFKDAFKLADAVLNSGVRNVTDLVVMNGLINLDFADIRSVMAGMGKAMMGMGEGEGEGRAVQAAEAAISNPLLDDITMRGARGVLINITGGPDMTLFEVDEAANRIREEVDAEANIIFGSTFDDAMEGKLRVSVVATGFDSATIKPELQVAPAAEFDQAMIVEPSTAESVSSAGDFGEFSGGSLNGEPADDQALNGHGIDGDQDSDDSWDAWAPEKPSINPQPLPLRGASDDKPYKNGDARRESASEFGSFVDGNTLRKLDPFGDDDWGKNHANGAAFFENKPEKPRHTVTPMPPVSGGESRQKVVDEALVEDVTAWITRKYLGPKKAVSDKPVNGSANGSAAFLSQLNGHAAVAGDLASTSEDSQAAMDSGAEMTAGIAQPESEKDPEIAAQSDLARDDDLGHEDNAVANGAPDSDPVPSFLQEGATIPVEASASIPAPDEPSRSETDDDDEDQNSGGSSGAPETAKPAKGGAIRNLLRSLNPISGGTTNRRSIDTGRKVLDRLNRLHGYPDSEEGASHA